MVSKLKNFLTKKHLHFKFIVAILDNVRQIYFKKKYENNS